MTKSNNDDRSFIEKARAAWEAEPGTVLPEWVRELAVYADANGLAAAGTAIGYSYSAVSMVLGGKYGGALDKIEQATAGAFMGLTVSCPGTGEAMPRNICLDWQKKLFEPSSQKRCRMYRACRSGCPNFRKGGSDGR